LTTASRVVSVQELPVLRAWRLRRTMQGDEITEIDATVDLMTDDLTNDRPNCSGLLLLSTFFVSCWAYYMRVGI